MSIIAGPIAIHAIAVLFAVGFVAFFGIADEVVEGESVVSSHEIDGMKWLANAASLDTRFVDGLPTALIKPLSGSGARGMMVDTMTTFGPDSFPSRLAGILQGSSDTTFYVIAVYFGAIGIKNTRYTVGAMLLADLVGIITAIVLAYLFFG